MKAEYELLNHEMLQDIDRCMQLELPEKEKAESSFWIGNNYWKKLKDMVKDKKFIDDMEEIEFSREVKPNFTFHIGYFALLSEALQFVPEPRVCAIAFWKEENAFSRFCQKHEAFVSYYESGERHGDTMYFLRENNTRRYTPVAPLYDVDMDLVTSHDHVLRTYLAHKKYNKYVKERIEQLNQEN